MLSDLELEHYWEKDSDISGDIDARTVSKRLFEIGARGDGRFSLLSMVEDSRAEDSPLHNYFDWGETGEYRLKQARYLLENLRVLGGHNEDFPLPVVDDLGEYDMHGAELYMHVVQMFEIPKYKERFWAIFLCGTTTAWCNH